MISLEDAFAAYAARVNALEAETVDVRAAGARVLAEPAHAQHDLPGFDQSALDGYAFAARSIAGAGPGRPVRLPVVLEIPAAGSGTRAQLPAGSAARIFTGGAMPHGADTVVGQERVERDGDVLVVAQAPTPGANVRRQAEEIRAGVEIAPAGTRIGPGLLAALVQAGLASVRVHRRPRVLVLVSGDEVRPVGSALRLGEVHDSNGPLLLSLLRHWGDYPARAEHLADDAATVHAALVRARMQADLVLTCGGASVGDRDFMVGTVRDAGFQQVFWRVAQKPGKPLLFATTPGCHWLALPGNPGAVLACGVVHVRRVLDLLEGVRGAQPRWLRGRLAQPLHRDRERDLFVRMTIELDASGIAQLSSLPNQDSHMLSNLARAQVLAHVARGSGPARAGEVIDFTFLPG